MKPFLKWAGGKRQLLKNWILPVIHKHLSEDKTFYEPFVGAGSVFLELEHSKVVINDSNEDLMLCYTVIKNYSDELLNVLERLKVNHSKEHFYQVRALDRDPIAFAKLSNVERAARMIYLNKTCFNGLYRVNKKGQFNTPIGKYKNPLIYDERNIRDISDYFLKNDILIKNQDFENVVKDAEKGDFIYFDPPYDYEIKGFTDYQKEGFNAFDLTRLKLTCDNLIKKGCKVLISNHDTKRVRELFSSKQYELITVNYKVEEIEVNRYIGSKIEYRKKAQEVLIYGSQKE
jgi:DNA adenine methylase